MKEISYAHQRCIFLFNNNTKTVYCEILLQFNNFFSFENIIYSYDGKAEFLVAITSV